MSSIVTDERLLRQACEPVKDVREGGEIARKLTFTLERHNKKQRMRSRKTFGKIDVQFGVGLSAPQIGIQKQVCLIYINQVPLILMNPVIVAHSECTAPFKEGCLSFPNKEVETRRWVWVKVKTLNIGEKVFGPTTPEGWDNRYALLKSIAVQHEIAHIKGLLFTDFVIEDGGRVPEFDEWDTWAFNKRRTDGQATNRSGNQCVDYDERRHPPAPACGPNEVGVAGR